MTIFGYFECADLRLGTKTMRSFSALMIFLVGGCLLLRAIRTKLLNSKSRYSLFWRIRGLLIGCFLLRK